MRSLYLGFVCFADSIISARLCFLCPHSVARSSSCMRLALKSQ